MVRGPGSALYGANAFSGVVNITTPTAREVIGTKVTLAGGELETFRGDLRHASVFAGDRFGFRFNAGYNRSDTYTPHPHPTRRHVAPARVRRGHRRAGRASSARSGRSIGQTTDPVTGDALGDRDPLVNGYGSGRLDYYLEQRLGALGGRRRVAGPERDLRDRHRPRPGDQGDQALRPGGDGGRPVQRVRLLEQPDLARAAVLAPVGPAARGAERHLPRRGPDQLELPAGARPRGRRRVGPEHPGQHQRHADEPGQRRPERRPLLDLRPGGVQAASRSSARWARAAVDDGDLFDTPVLAQGRPGLQPRREQLVPVLGEQGVPDAQLLGVLPAGAGGGAVDAGPATLQATIQGYYSRLRRARSPPHSPA